MKKKGQGREVMRRKTICGKKHVKKYITREENNNDKKKWDWKRERLCNETETPVKTVLRRPLIAVSWKKKKSVDAA